MNLDDLRYFLALARYRRLTVAADRLEVEHTTIRRRVVALEKRLGTRLFDKTPNGWVPTLAGQKLLPYAQRIELEAEGARAKLAGQDNAPRGTVRILATDGFGSTIIAPGLAQLRWQYPQIEVELVTANVMLNHAVGGFDIAVTILQPQQSGLNSIHLSDYELRLYASQQYLSSRPSISAQKDLKDHDMIWFVESLLELPELRPGSEELVSQANTIFRTTNLWAQLEATAAGAGLGLLPCFIAHNDRRLVPVLHDEVRVARRFWMIIPSRLLNTELVTTVGNHLMQIAADRSDCLVPPSS